MLPEHRATVLAGLEHILALAWRRWCYRLRRSFQADSSVLRPLYFVFGIILVALGVIGIFVPLMPTTIFLILAAWCFARSSRRAEAWLLQHRLFGPIIETWRREQAIARRPKIVAVCGMAAGFLIFLIAARPALWLAVLVAAILGACAAYVITRPEPGSARR